MKKFLSLFLVPIVIFFTIIFLPLLLSPVEWLIVTLLLVFISVTTMLSDNYTCKEITNKLMKEIEELLEEMTSIIGRLIKEKNEMEKRGDDFQKEYFRVKKELEELKKKKTKKKNS